MLALAHHLEEAIERGTFRNRSELARRLGIVDSRVTQILSLCHLAPDIQEDVLLFEVTRGAELFTETELRKISRILEWDEQRRAYALLRPGFGRHNERNRRECEGLGGATSGVSE